MKTSLVPSCIIRGIKKTWHVKQFSNLISAQLPKSNIYFFCSRAQFFLVLCTNLNVDLNVCINTISLLIHSRCNLGSVLCHVSKPAGVSIIPLRCLLFSSSAFFQDPYQVVVSCAAYCQTLCCLNTTKGNYAKNGCIVKSLNNINQLCSPFPSLFRLLRW